MALENLYTSTKTLAVSPSFLAFISAWDAFLMLSGQTIYKLFRDGTFIAIGTKSFYDSAGVRVGGLMIWLDGLTAATCYPADQITGQKQYDQVLNPAWQPFPALGDYLDDLRGLYLKINGSSIQILRLSDGALQATVALGGATYTGLCSVSETRVLAYRNTDGVISLVDYVNRKLLWQSQVPGFAAAGFDSTHNLFVTVQSDHKVRLFLMSATPAVLSNPAFYPIPSRIKQYQGYTIRTRLTGDRGEPCADYWVNWSLGIPAWGALEKSRTKTDVDGYAENFYFAANLGDETVTVEVAI
jgi:hypothetical protein